MKQFFKIVFGSCLGVFLAGVVLFGVIGGIAGKVVADETKSEGIKPNSILEITFNDVIPEKSGNVPQDPYAFETEKKLGLHDMVAAIENAKDDDDIKGIFINGMGSSGGQATKALIREALVDFKDSGKFIIAHSKYYTQGSYYMASVADKVYVHPLGGIDFRGFSSQIPFFKNMLDKVGVNMEVFYAGKFKGASEPYRRTNLSDENRLQIREYIDGLYNIYLTDISESRDMSVDRLKKIADDFLIREPEDAVKYELADAVGYYDEAVSDMKVRMGLDKDDKLKKTSIQNYAKTVDKKTEFSVKDRVAVLFAEGNIVMGEADPGTIGDDNYMKTIRKIRNDDKVKALVLRVNSGGGSALASENIWRELMLLKEKGVPIVVSMGDVAASGGYYIACMADKIYAEEATITGSIGVVAAMPNTTELMNEKIGITFDTVNTGRYSNSMSPVFDMREDERRILQESIEDMYDTFLTRVADGRKIDKSAVHEIAQGRVWTGNKAKEIGLVDEIGGLNEAIADAQELAGLEKYRLKEYPLIKDPMQQMIEKFMGKKGSPAEAFIRSELKEMYPYYEEAKAIKDMKGIQARMPWKIEIK